MPTLELETMRCEMEGPLARLRLNRPEALNAANWAWVNDLVTATSALAGNAEVRVVIVSGEGRAFCSGLDVKELARGSLSTDWFATWERGVTALANLDAITIAAVHGYCRVGGRRAGPDRRGCVSPRSAGAACPRARSRAAGDPVHSYVPYQTPDRSRL
jgi:enoyl-CoA hydratase/carnithine racemase